MNNWQKIAKTICILCFLFSHNFGSCQSQNLSGLPGVQSPNAASMGRYGEIPVSLFNGSVNISIPVTEIRSGNLLVPITLSYDAGGCKPGNHPSWVGLNWNLQSGGVIRRQTNGQFDECKIDGSTSVSYLNNYGMLANSNWTVIQGSDVTNVKDQSPDEFNFSVGNISGSFMLNHEGKWIVRSKTNLNLKVEYEVQDNYYFNPSYAARAFTKFILTTGDGTKYIFGGSANAIEFSIPALRSSTEPWNDPGYEVFEPTDIYGSNQASAWFLTEIISPTNNKIIFQYSRGASYHQETYTEISSGPRIGRSPGIYYTGDINQNCNFGIASSYLSSITTDENVIYTFIRSESNELKWVNRYKTIVRETLYADDWLYYKLDSLTVKADGRFVQKFAFKYVENPAERLKLAAMEHIAPNVSTPISKYSIEYSNKKLPIYNTGEVDHWGFYNHRNFYGSTLSQGGTATVPNLTNYYESRNTDTAYMNAEIIKKITYPTGGYTLFEFEPHQYSKIVNQISSPFSMDNLPTDNVAGGLRIKKIQTFSSSGEVPIVKEYYYLTNYLQNGTRSSGVLGGKPVYYESGNTSSYPYERFSSLPLNGDNTTNGNHITYTQVTEKSLNGYIEYIYYNQDNGFMDKEPFAKYMATPSSSYAKNAFGKLNLERGLEKEIKYYSQSKTLVKHVTNEYNDDVNRYQNYIRSKQHIDPVTIPGFNIVSYPIYTFYPYLKKQTTKFLDVNLTGIEYTEEYAYDPATNLLDIKTIKRSDGTSLLTKYLYPKDKASISPYNTMIDVKNMVNTLIGERRYKNSLSTLLESNNYNYSSYNGDVNQIYLSSEEYQKESLPSFLKSKYLKYDLKGNLLEKETPAGLKTSYKWGYNQQYPIAEIKNASLNEFYHQNFEENTGGFDGDIALDNTRPHTGKNSLRIINPSTTEKVSHSTVMTPIVLTAPRKFVFSGWVYSDAPSVQLFLFMMKPGETSYFSYVDSQQITTTGKWTFIQKVTEVPADVTNLFLRLDNNAVGTVWFDDLRIQPADASMSTYTYQPLVGMTSAIDNSGKTVYYEYDSFQRLKNIKDQNGNIVKTYDYHYKQ